MQGSEQVVEFKFWNPITAVFGVFQKQHGITSHQANAFAFSSLLANWLRLLQWKDVQPSSVIEWVREVMMYLPMENLVSSTL